MLHMKKGLKSEISDEKCYFFITAPLKTNGKN